MSPPSLSLHTVPFSPATPTAYESPSAYPLLSAPLAFLRRGLVVPQSVMGSLCIHVSPS
ncbi:uncharacterized protein DS421_9g260250 [Arachis hypogaea]|nr:uncharacterized protein DS421_9g260250 [Arachis hypogaea]